MENGYKLKNLYLGLINFGMCKNSICSPFESMLPHVTP